MNDITTKKILCNYYTNGIDQQPGEQPIRVFYNLIKADFEGIKESISQFKSNFDIRQVQIEFLTENIKVIGPSTNGHKITLHDTFLSFLWAYIYSIIVTTPFGGIEVTLKENSEARDLRNYAHGLINEFTTWDVIKLPNPELFGKDEKWFIGVSNKVFILSVRFILLHEFAHIYLEHPFVPKNIKTPENIKKMEVDADNVAIDWTLQSIETKDNFTVGLSLISALNSISFSPNKFSESNSHPAPEDRIARCLERLNLIDSNFLWGYAVWSIMEWQTNHELFYIPMNHEKDNFKKTFYDTINELKEFKKTGINNFKK